MQSIILALLLSGLNLLLASRFLSRDLRGGGGGGAQDSSALSSTHEDETIGLAVPLHSLKWLRQSPPLHFYLHRRTLELMVIVVCAVLRVETINRIVGEIECSYHGVEVCMK